METDVLLEKLKESIKGDLRGRLIIVIMLFT